jgi:hypothetical protein
MNQPTIQVAERFKATGPAAPTFVRWRAGARRESRLLPPLAGDHPAANRPCPACWIPLGDGRPVQLLAIGPTDDETRVQHEALRWYSALALLLHADCLGTAPAAARVHADDCTGCEGPGIVPCDADEVRGNLAFRNGMPIKDLETGR